MGLRASKPGREARQLAVAAGCWLSSASRSIVADEVGGSCAAAGSVTALGRGLDGVGQTGAVPHPEWPSVLASYGHHLHETAGDGHHVVSPLGAWMVVALCGGLAGANPVARVELGEALGCDPSEAAAFAGTLLSQPHPLVVAGAGLWVRPGVDTPIAARWRASLPVQVDTGDIPSQEELDQWASERTLGLIKRFPLALTPEVVGLLASALATKVSWEVPFDVVDASELRPSRWAGEVASVLRTPPDPRHAQFITDTAGAGPLAVHLAQARGGLLVASAIAADAAVPAGHVLAEAERIVSAEAGRSGSVERLPLFDLPLGAGPVWDIREEQDGRGGPLEGEERFTSIMPAWSAKNDIDLTGAPGLGLGAAAAAIARVLELVDWRFEARQSAVAEYSAVGFEAAAVTGLAVRGFARPAPKVAPRRAVVRFRHPYAVVAATRNDPRQPSPAAWHGLPVFSAWVAEATSASVIHRENDGD